MFFAMPHIAIDSAGQVGAVVRPGRADKSCACGALVKLQPRFKVGRCRLTPSNPC